MYERPNLGSKSIKRLDQLLKYKKIPTKNQNKLQTQDLCTYSNFTDTRKST